MVTDTLATEWWHPNVTKHFGTTLVTDSVRLTPPIVDALAHAALLTFEAPT
jgi:hypothetical protein